MNEIVLKVVNLHKIYKTKAEEVYVLKGINLEVRKGEIVSIMGPSGVGKTTFLNICGGLDKPSQGKVFLDGEDIFSYDDKRIARIRNEKIGFVFQFFQLIPELTVLENVILPALIKGDKNSLDKGEKILEEVGLKDKSMRFPQELSGGEQQRVAIARALINSPVIVMMDEPTGNLDETTAEEIHKLILRLNKEKGITFLIATHKEKLAKIGNRIIKLIGGKFYAV